MHFELFLQTQNFSIDYKPKRFEVHAFSKENKILFYVRELSRKWLTVLCCAAARRRAIVTVVVRVLVLAQYVSSCGIFIFLLWLSCLLQSFETSAAIENSASCEVRLVIWLLLVKTLSILKLKMVSCCDGLSAKKVKIWCRSKRSYFLKGLYWNWSATEWGVWCSDM